MNYKEIRHSQFGKSLYADNGIVQLIIPLEYGIRIGHFSFLNGENVFYVQPENSSEFSTEDGWRLYSGHRLWLAPEQDDTYTPDNDPISYSILAGKTRRTPLSTRTFRFCLQRDITISMSAAYLPCGTG